MKEKIELSKKNIILLLIGTFFVFTLLIGATFAYFNISQINNTSISNIDAGTSDLGNATLVNGSNLRLTIKADDMLKSDDNKTFWATTSGVPSLMENTVNIASVNIVGQGTMSCDYTLNITKSGTNDLYTNFKNWVNPAKGNNQLLLNINDGDQIVVKDFNSDLTFPMTMNGKITNLTSLKARNITASFKLVNLKNADQSFISGSDIKFAFNFSNFNCKIDGNTEEANKTLTTKLISDGSMWQSKLEGDGYRFVGSGNATSATTPSNFICFGTTDKTACKNNEDKYLYRIIGVFDDASGNKHAKLIKYKQLGPYKWNDVEADVDWGNSTLSTNLNGSYFVTNATYDYMQNNTWNNKIENWAWSAVNIKLGDGGINYNNTTPSNIYLHEMNRVSKASSIGSWTTPFSKIGLMYASDYALSLGETAKSMTTNINVNAATLKTGWMHQSNNDITKSEWDWIISRLGLFGNIYLTLIVHKSGIIDNDVVYAMHTVRPVFYLTPNTMYNSGTGTYKDPIIILN